ncbi:MAG: HIT family protein [Dehalococcoidia bacterium]
MSCTFCEIIDGKRPASIRYEDDEVVVFDNKLKWAPVMLLVVPKKHMSQEQFWQDASKAGGVAVEMGWRFCPGGFRLLSNFGPDAMQSQEHGHVHVIGGTFLGPYA